MAYKPTTTLSVTPEKIALDVAKIKKYFFESKTVKPLFVESNDSILRIPYKSFQRNRQFFYIVVINAKSGVEQIGYVSRILLMARLSKGISYIERSDTTCRIPEFCKDEDDIQLYFMPSFCIGSRLKRRRGKWESHDKDQSVNSIVSHTTNSITPWAKTWNLEMSSEPQLKQVFPPLNVPPIQLPVYISIPQQMKFIPQTAPAFPTFEPIRFKEQVTRRTVQDPVPSHISICDPINLVQQVTIPFVRSCVITRLKLFKWIAEGTWDESRLCQDALSMLRLSKGESDAVKSLNSHCRVDPCDHIEYWNRTTRLQDEVSYWTLAGIMSQPRDAVEADIAYQERLAALSPGEREDYDYVCRQVEKIRDPLNTKAIEFKPSDALFFNSIWFDPPNKWRQAYEMLETRLALYRIVSLRMRFENLFEWADITRTRQVDNQVHIEGTTTITTNKWLKGVPWEMFIDEVGRKDPRQHFRVIDGSAIIPDYYDVSIAMGIMKSQLKKHLYSERFVSDNVLQELPVKSINLVMDKLIETKVIEAEPEINLSSSSTSKRSFNSYSSSLSCSSSNLSSRSSSCSSTEVMNPEIDRANVIEIEESAPACIRFLIDRSKSGKDEKGRHNDKDSRWALMSYLQGMNVSLGDTQELMTRGANVVYRGSAEGNAIKSQIAWSYKNLKSKNALPVDHSCGYFMKRHLCPHYERADDNKDMAKRKCLIDLVEKKGSSAGARFINKPLFFGSTVMSAKRMRVEIKVDE